MSLSKAASVHRCCAKSTVVKSWKSFCHWHFLQLYCSVGISPLANSGFFPQGTPAATESRYPTHSACLVFKYFHKPPTSDMVYRVFNMRTDVNACDCTRGCTDTVRESAPRADLRHRGIESASAACRSAALLIDLHSGLQSNFKFPLPNTSSNFQIPVPLEGFEARVELTKARMTQSWHHASSPTLSAFELLRSVSGVVLWKVGVEFGLSTFRQKLPSRRWLTTVRNWLSKKGSLNRVHLVMWATSARALVVFLLTRWKLSMWSFNNPP